MQNILVVEDDIDIQEILNNYLTDAGYKVIIASDGVAGIAKFNSEIDLVLLDIMLPKIDGYGVCEVIRQKSKVPIIMLTALSDEEILDLYVVRWEIEVYFRDCKMKLAVDKYQIRSANGIKHFWLIASLAYMIACFESKRYNFSEGYHLLSQTIRREQISFIFDYAQNGGDKSALLENIA